MKPPDRPGPDLDDEQVENEPWTLKVGTVGRQTEFEPGRTRLIAGFLLMVISVLWFYGTLEIAKRTGSFMNAVGWAMPAVLFLISIYLVVSARTSDPLRAVRGLAACGLVIAMIGVFAYALFPWLAQIWTVVIGIGTLLIIPLALRVARRTKTR